MDDKQTEGETIETKRPRRPPRAKAKATPDADTVLELTWTLHELPSSQHNAGLAGLALYLRFLERKPDRRGTCALKSMDANGLTLVVDCAGMQGLFDDVYDASLEEQARDKKLQKGKGDAKEDLAPKRIEDRGPASARTSDVHHIFCAHAAAKLVSARACRGTRHPLSLAPRPPSLRRRTPPQPQPKAATSARPSPPTGLRTSAGSLLRLPSPP